MNAKQRRFVEEYLVDLNATQAAIRSGYSAKTAYSIGQRLLRHVEVAAAIKVEADARSERTKVTQDYVLQRLQENVERSMQNIAVTDRAGHLVSYTYEGAVANGALKLLGQHLGMFLERSEVTGKGGEPLNVRVTHEVVDPANGVASDR